jgi:hypothetical protein
MSGGQQWVSRHAVRVGWVFGLAAAVGTLLAVGTPVAAFLKPVPVLLCAVAILRAPATDPRARAVRRAAAAAFLVLGVLAALVEVFGPDPRLPPVLLIVAMLLLAFAFDRMAHRRELVDGATALAWALLTAVLITPSAEGGRTLSLVLFAAVALALWRAYAADPVRAGVGVGLLAVNVTLFSADLLLVPVPRPFVVAFFLAGLPFTAGSIVRWLRKVDADGRSAVPAVDGARSGGARVT